IEISGICTATRTDEFYSHRAENGKTGRFAAVFMLRE
ncbi:MAG: multicopper polyphenol oxidase, partial [Candidatus Thermofonsia Clade 1 bacterium]